MPFDFIATLFHKVLEGAHNDQRVEGAVETSVAPCHEPIEEKQKLCYLQERVFCGDELREHLPCILVYVLDSHGSGEHSEVRQQPFYGESIAVGIVDVAQYRIVARDGFVRCSAEVSPCVWVDL